MLTPEEKERIEAEERFRHQVHKKIQHEQVTRVRWPFKLAILVILLLILYGLAASR